MLHKSILIYASYIFIIGALFASPLYSALGPSSAVGGPNKPPAGQFPMDMSEEEMKMLTEFIDNLDQETLDALNAIGEEIIKEADELGIDPLDYIQLQAQAQQEYEEKTEKVKGTPVTSPQASAEAQTVQELFKGIAKIIPEIMQKSVSDINLSNDILPFKYRLDDLVYYCTRLADEKMLKYLADSNFKTVIDDARNLYKALTMLNDQFVVAEFNLEGEDPYEILGVSRSASQNDIVAAYDKLVRIIEPDRLELQLIKDGKTDDEIKKEVARAKARFDSVNNAYDTLRSKEEASYILNKILDAISEAVDTKKIVEQATKILQLHEPEVLKLKKEQEKLEAEARKTQDAFIKKRALVSRSFNMPMPKQKGGGKRYDEGRGGHAGYAPTKAPKKQETVKPTKISTPGAKGGGGGAKPPTGKKPEDKEGKEKKNKKGGAKPAAKGKPGEPAKGKEGEVKKPATHEVSEALGAIDVSLTGIKKVIKHHKEMINEANQLSAFMTTAFTGTPEEIAKQKEAYTKFLKELSDAFVLLESSVRSGLKRFEKAEKKEELKQYKDQVAERIKKFEKLDKYALIRILFAKDFAPGKVIQIKGENKGMSKDKEDLLFAAIAEGSEEPYLDSIRDVYKNVKSKVMPKEETKKPGLPTGPTPAPNIGSFR